LPAVELVLLGETLTGVVAVVLAATMLIVASLGAWARDSGLYRPLARTCMVSGMACLGVAALRPGPLLLGIALVFLMSVPWVHAVMLRLNEEADPPGG
jgi:hypothetical protein